MRLSENDILAIRNLHETATSDALLDLAEGEARNANCKELGEVAQIYLPPYPEHFFHEHHGVGEWYSREMNQEQQYLKTSCLEKLKELGIVQK